MEQQQKQQEKFQERQTAVKITIEDINNSKYIKTQGEFTPNYIETQYQEQISRVNIIGIIINKEQELPAARNIIIDDGTGRIIARTFDTSPQIENFSVGDIVIVIGRPREFNNMIYVIPEVVKKVSNPVWMQIRKLELQVSQKNRPEKKIQTKTNPQENVSKKQESAQVYEEEAISAEVVEKENKQDKNQFERFVEVIKQLDTGDGADMETVIARFEGDGEKLMRILLEEGEIFEVKPGRIKVLE